MSDTTGQRSDDGGGNQRHDGAPGHAQDHDAGGNDRTTAPMSEFTTREAGIGAAIAVVGLLLVVGVPLALTL